VHAEHKVYKCSGPDGAVVFAAQPCGANAAEVHIDAGKGLRDSSSGTALRDLGDGVEDSRCRQDADNLRSREGSGNIEELERRRDSLRNSLQYANNNMAGATWESGVRKEIGDLETAIGQERTRLSLTQAQGEGAYRAAIAECDRKRESTAQRRRAEDDAAAREAASAAAATKPKPKDDGQ